MLYNALRNRIQRLLRQHRQENWNKKIKSLRTADGSIWPIARALRKPRREIPSLNTPLGKAHTNEEKAAVFAEMLSQRFTNSLESDLENTCTDTWLSLRNCPISEPHQITAAELIATIASLKEKSAPGPDGISNRLLKNLPKPLISILTRFYNFLLSISYFPTSWKHAKIIMLLKPKKPPTQPSSYRPISLLDTLGKLFEAVIHHRMKTFLREEKIISPEQTGFRPKTSTVHQVLRLTEAIASGFNKKFISHAVFLDLEAAFDRVWTLGLTHKLSQLPIPLYLLKLIQSFTSDRSFYVQINSAASTFYPITSGVPQGAILSPTLFNLFVNDTPTSPSTKLFLYADDTTILAQGPDPEKTADLLQSHLDLYEDWADQWKLSVNAEKCSHIVFSRRPKAGNGPRIFYGNKIIPREYSTRYLGVEMDRKLTWSKHIHQTVQKATGIHAALFPLLKSNSPLPLKTKLLLYNATIRPILSYASPVWLYAAASHLKKIQTVENKIIRKIIGAPWFVKNQNIRKDLQITPILSKLKASLENFSKSFKATENSLLVNLWDYIPPLKPKHRLPKCALNPSHIPIP